MEQSKIAPFYAGQKVVCCVPFVGNWTDPLGNPIDGPINNEIVTVKDCQINLENRWELFLCEYPNTENGYEYLSTGGQIMFKPLVEMVLPLISYSKVLEEQPVSAN
jgi:hypothetical protein